MIFDRVFNYLKDKLKEENVYDEVVITPQAKQMADTLIRDGGQGKLLSIYANGEKLYTSKTDWYILDKDNGIGIKGSDYDDRVSILSVYQIGKDSPFFKETGELYSLVKERLKDRRRESKEALASESDSYSELVDLCDMFNNVLRVIENHNNRRRRRESNENKSK